MGSCMPESTHCGRICSVQCLCLFFREVMQLRGNSHYPIRVALLYFMPIVAHNFVFACTR
jgi:hypothetical protein